jgi:hypothetical protein
MSIPEFILCGIRCGTMLMNDELEGTLQEDAYVYLKYYHNIRLQKIRKTDKTTVMINRNAVEI